MARARRRPRARPSSRRHHRICGSDAACARALERGVEVGGELPPTWPSRQRAARGRPARCRRAGVEPVAHERGAADGRRLPDHRTADGPLTTKPDPRASPGGIDGRSAPSGVASRWTTTAGAPARAPRRTARPKSRLGATARVLGEHGAARVGRQADELGAALAATGREDRAAGAGAHAQPEAVRLGPTAVVRLEGALAHGRLRRVGPADLARRGDRRTGRGAGRRCAAAPVAPPDDRRPQDAGDRRGAGMRRRPPSALERAPRPSTVRVAARRVKPRPGTPCDAPGANRRSSIGRTGPSGRDTPTVPTVVADSGPACGQPLDGVADAPLRSRHRSTSGGDTAAAPAPPGLADPAPHLWTSVWTPDPRRTR